MDDRMPRALLFVMSSEERKGSARTPHRTYFIHAGEEAIAVQRVGETAAPADVPPTAEQRAILRQIAGLFVGRLPAPILTDVAPDDVALLCRVQRLSLRGSAMPARRPSHRDDTPMGAASGRTPPAALKPKELVVMSRRTLVAAASASALLHVMPIASRAIAAEPAPTPLADVEKPAFRDVLRDLNALPPSQRRAFLTALHWLADRFEDGTIPTGMTMREAIAAGHITVTRRDGYLWYQAA